MRRSFLAGLSFLIMAGGLCAQSTPWEKQGIASGSVNAVVKPGGPVLETYISTESGIFASQYPQDNAQPWFDDNLGIRDLSITRVEGCYVDMDTTLLTLAGDGVYARLTGGPGGLWLYSPDDGLVDSGGNKLGYRDAVSVTIGPNPDPQKPWSIYLALAGQGIYTKSFCRDGFIGKWCTTSTYIYEEYLDSQSEGSEWSHAEIPPQIPPPCGFPEPDAWSIVSTSYTHTGSYAWFVPDGFVTNQYIDDALVLNNITLGTDNILSFYHSYSLDGQAGGMAWHGGVLEISVLGAGVWTDLGPQIITGQYNSTISAACNPLDGRAAWSGDTLMLGTPYQVKVDLSPYNGQTVSIRWRLASDDVNTFYPGWYIDDITIGTETAEEWVELNPQIPNPNVTDLYIDGMGILYASAKYYDSSFTGNVWQLDTLGGVSWTEVGAAGIEYLSLGGVSCNEMIGAVQGEILAGTRDHGVHVFDGAGFVPWCGVTDPLQLPEGDILDVSVYPPPIDNPPTPSFKSGAVTKHSVYMLDSGCTTPYILFSAFKGAPVSVLSDYCVGEGGGGDLIVGTLGTGLFRFPCNTPASPPSPLGNEGQMTEGSEIKTKNVSKLIVTDADPGDSEPPVMLASSLTDGMYKSRYGIWNMGGVLGDLGYFVRYFFNPLNNPGEFGGVRASCIVVPPGYDETGVADTDSLMIFLGTLDDGVFASRDGGGSWAHLDNMPSSEAIVDMVISPDFSNDLTLFLLTENAKIYRSNNAGNNWTMEAQLTVPSHPLDIVKGTDLVISPGYASDSILYAATTQGLFKRLSPGTWSQAWDGGPVLSVDLSALFDESMVPIQDYENSTIVIGTELQGMLYSINFGSTFSSIFPVGDISFSSIPTVKFHPASDAVGSNRDLLLFFASGVYSASGESTTFGYTTYNVTNGTWNPAQNIGGQDDFKITSIVFEPGFDRSNSSKPNYIYTGHSNSKVWRAVWGEWTWNKMAGFFSSPPEINDLAVKPDEPNIVLAGTMDYGVMISFDGGLTFFPAGIPKRGNGTIIHDVSALTITDTPPSEPALIAAGTFGDGMHYRTFDSLKTLYYPDPSDPTWDPRWYASTGLTSGEVYDVEYRGPYCEMWAGADSGTYLSSDYGRTWTFDAPSGFSNVYEIGDCYTPKRALNGFTWGARAGVKAPARASGDGSAWLKIGEGSWTVQATAGLDTDCDFEAIHQDSIGVVSAGTVFLGCAYSPTSPWIRVYRGEGCPTVGEPSGTCAWEASDEGMEGTSGAVEAFAKSSNGLLVGVSESSVGAGDGGVFFTDTHSKGYAWVDVSQNGYAMDCKSSTTLTSSGTTLYSGTSCEGAYASTSIDTEGINPVAYYTWGQDEWDDAAFSFEDRSCCDTTDYSWDFSGTFDWGASVVHHYTPGGEVVLPTLWATNATSSDDFTGSMDEPVYIAYLSDVAWSGSDVTVTWERLASDTGFSYEVYRDTDPDGSGRALVQTIPAGDGTWCDAVTCWYTFTDGAAFACYRVRVVP
ncbi:MAG TPA: hypothetical protein PK014_04665 [Thermoanaerobaculia bacterium]|nr:hypothetical protein [Thermoanaerobaculia bacterium]HXK67942.1 hypothetical protein [Thermoanaerobaculia bacterium]